MPDTPPRPDFRSARRRPAARSADAASVPGLGLDDRFFRHIVSSMRNGVIAFRRDGTLALMNDEATGIFGLTRGADDTGRPFAEVLRDRQAIVRVLSSAFELSHLPKPRRAEADRAGSRHRLHAVPGQRRCGDADWRRDVLQGPHPCRAARGARAAARSPGVLGEMAAGIAHELKNPLAGIEVMAGLLRRQVPDSKDAQSLLADILSEAKLANAIVVEMLEFVRPVRLQVEHTDVADVLQQSVTMAESKASRGQVIVKVDVEPGLPQIRPTIISCRRSSRT
jgi:signal transduction histidine kinase